MQIEIIKPDDFHVHFRQGEDLRHYVEATARHFARALVMPNTQPAIRSAELLTQYKQEIENALYNFDLAHAGQGVEVNANINSKHTDKQYKIKQHFTPLMTFKIYKTHTHEEIASMQRAGAIAAKLYPQGVTTHSEDGIANIEEIFPICESLQDLDLVLSIHGEDPTSFVLDREKNFLQSLDTIIKNFPRLRIVLEHITTEDAVDYIRTHASPHLAATITVHHLLFDLDALLGGHLNPHYFCKPVLKTPKDTHALQKVVRSSHPNFFLGTDSAPHKRELKECSSGCAGVFSSPVAIPLLTEFFYTHGNNSPEQQSSDSPSNTEVWSKALEQFTSRFGAEFYKLPYNSEHICIAQKEWEVPKEYHGVVPLMAGTVLQWAVVE